MGTKKQVMEHMQKLRQVYKGEAEVFWEQVPEVQNDVPAEAL